MSRSDTDPIPTFAHAPPAPRDRSSQHIGWIPAPNCHRTTIWFPSGSASSICNNVAVTLQPTPRAPIAPQAGALMSGDSELRVTFPETRSQNNGSSARFVESVSTPVVVPRSLLNQSLHSSWTTPMPDADSPQALLCAPMLLRIVTV